ncbi:MULTISPECIES: IclR family transcriptional regulator [unclassified Achromobacter]|uniref:IclR family transcriptional regulator n=1 Tax=unclassified Achromobacter TaxID=2626865 RepID=UPI000B518CF1|nr:MULTISPECIES: IclR family transcriptional regulator [unclassified Achromobacter]OWT71566.1 hypothetical protein CEY05_25615 [Achromobacter sp. HZ34]OWT73223.1 hypothetical protein CEY04_24450 [Achromobacter sp. HZ28]
MTATTSQSSSSTAERQAASSGTVSRVLQLLSVLADASGPIGVKQVAEQMSLAPSTVHRLLQLLRKEGFVDTASNSHQYAIGTQFYRVAARVYAAGSPHDIALPLIQAIADEFNETVVFGLYQPVQRSVTFTASADGGQRLKYHLDMHTPLSLVWGASGKAILAFLPPDIARKIIESEGPSPASGAPVPDLADLEKELARTRRRGYAVTDGEKFPDARGIAAPVYGPRGVLGCICLTSPKSRMPHGEIAQIGEKIVAQAAVLSQALGASDP